MTTCKFRLTNVTVRANMQAADEDRITDEEMIAQVKCV